MDIVDNQTRSRMMSGIRGKNTHPEMFIRRLLHSKGFRYRLHPKGLPGIPDIVLPKYKCVIFVHGCFWHGHECHLFKLPSSRRAFWEEKINRNQKRDKENKQILISLGWRVLSIWECSLRGKERIDKDILGVRISLWLKGLKRSGTFVGGE